MYFFYGDDVDAGVVSTYFINVFKADKTTILSFKIHNFACQIF